MDVLYFDVETYYDSEYSLTKMDPPSYILDPRFELIISGFALNDDPVEVIDGDDLPGLLEDLKRREIALVTHNAQFDASILSWRYNWRPKLIIDTLSISRTVLANKIKSHSLANVAAHLNLPRKATDVLINMRGLNKAAIQAQGLMRSFMEYCRNDVELCREIFKILSPELPDEEFLVHDLVLRMAVDPALHADVTVLAQYHEEVRTRRELTLARAMLLGIESEKDLMSNIKLATVLEGLGV